MYLDAMTMAAVADELQATLVGGRVQEVLQVDELTLGMEVYAGRSTDKLPGRHYLIASAHAQHARVHLTGLKLRRGVETPMPILLLMRKYVRDGRITGVRALSYERILHIDLAGSEGPLALVVETMGRHSNVILCGADGAVLDSIKRVGPRLSRVRPVLPGTAYRPPPPQDKLDPDQVTERRLWLLLEEAAPDKPVWSVLVNGVRGVSPLLAREVVYRASGSVDTPVKSILFPVAQKVRLSPLLDALTGLWQLAWEHAWQPCVALEEGGVAAFAPYRLEHYAHVEPAETISQAIDRYEQEQTTADSYGSARARVLALLDGARERVQARRSALQRQMVSQLELDRLRLAGEMILAYAHTIGRGQTVLEAEVEAEKPPLRIELDPQLGPVENAQAYFRRYDKAKGAAADVPALLARVALEVDYLDQLATDLTLASNRPEIDEVSSALVEAGYVPQTRRGQAQRGQPLRFVSPDGWPIWVGRSARQNHDLTFRRAGPDDLWLHAVDVAGAHVIVQAGGGEVQEQTLRRAAELAAYYSAARGEAGVLVAYTPRRYVRPIRGAGPGMVTYRHEQTIHVVPRAE